MNELKHYCQACGREIVFNGKYWAHVDWNPRHVAIPRE